MMQQKVESRRGYLQSACSTLCEAAKFSLLLLRARMKFYDFFLSVIKAHQLPTGSKSGNKIRQFLGKKLCALKCDHEDHKLLYHMACSFPSTAHFGLCV